MNPAICGVVVTYHPETDVRENIRMMVGECGHVIVVDNGSSAETQAQLAALAGVELIPCSENIGVAAALNLGARRAWELGGTWIVTFDQDSMPQPGMVAALWEAHVRHPRAAVVGPRIIEGGPNGVPYRWVRPHPRWSGLFQRVPCQGADLPEVTMLVTSGSMVELESWRSLGGFDERLFIDYVDIDYCLKVIRGRRSIAVAAAARLNHKLGARQEGRLLGKDFRPTHHAAFRHYYMARNRVLVWRRHAGAVPHWALFDLCFAFFNGFRVLLLERKKWVKLKAMTLGTWDGLRGRCGPCPADRRQAIET